MNSIKFCSGGVIKWTNGNENSHFLFGQELIALLMTVMAIQEHSKEEDSLQLRRLENGHARRSRCFSSLPSNSLEHFQTYCCNMMLISVRNSLHSYWEFIKFFFVLVNQEKQFPSIL